MAMKRASLFALIALCISFTTSLLAQQNTDLFTEIEVETGFVQTPAINADRVDAVPVKEIGTWLQISLKYKPVKKMDKESRDFAWQDDVSVDYEVLVPTGNGSNSVLLCGTVKYWSIRMDGEVHRDVVHVHPQFLKRYAPNLKLARTSLKDIHVKVKFSVNDADVGRGYDGKANEVAEKKAIFNKIATDSKIKRIKDSVMGRNKTPWRYINCDAYDLIKDSKDE